MKISIMTLSIVGQMLFKFGIDHDMDGFLEDYEEMLQLISEAGYDAVDVTGMELDLLTPNTIKSLLDKYNLSVSSLIYIAPFAAMDEEGFDARVEKAKKAIDAAKILETNVVMLVPQAHDGIENNTPKQIRAQMVKHWIPLAAYAAENGVHTVVEDTPELRLHFCKAEDFREVLDQVPGLEVVFDTGNTLFVDEDPCVYYEQFADKTRHIHLKDIQVVDPKTPFCETMQDGTTVSATTLGEGLVDLKRFLSLVKKHNYDGYLTVEFNNGPDGDYRKNLTLNRAYVENLIK